MPTTLNRLNRLNQLHRYHSLRHMGRRRKVLDNIFDDYRGMLGDRAEKLLCRMADVLDAGLGLNHITGEKRQCVIEKRARDIYNAHLTHVSRMMKALPNTQKVEQLERVTLELDHLSEMLSPTRRRNGGWSLGNKRKKFIGRRERTKTV